MRLLPEGGDPEPLKGTGLVRYLSTVLKHAHATGRVTLEYLSATDGVSYVSAGHYDDVMRKIGGQWRFASRKITFYYLSPLTQGWSGRPFPGRAKVR